MKKKMYLGIDPGMTSGAISLIEWEFNVDTVISCIDIPLTVEPNGKKIIDFVKLYDILILWRRFITHCTIEQVASMPMQNSQAMFRFGGGYYGIICVCRILKIPLIFISPNVWKKHYNLKAKGLTRSQFKNASRQLAMTLYPDTDLSKVKDSDRAESLLICRYGLYLKGCIKK